MILSRKLIVEQPFYDLEYETVQESRDNEKKLYFTGQYIMVNRRNKNNRVYEESEMAPAVNKFIKEYVNNHRAGGELNHSNDPDIKLERLAHKIVSLERDKHNPDYYIGKSEVITSNPSGKILEGLIKHNMRFGLSTKCLGRIEESSNSDAHYVKSPLIVSVDAVYEPSANSEFVNGILENKSYIIGDDGYVAEAYEKLEKKLSKYPSHHRDDIKKHIVESLATFLKSL
jgi:hypothetical protein